MAVRRSAGILVYRRAFDGGVEVLIGHMGGPFWAGREAGAWSVPKGEHRPDEDPVAAARREFAEELGVDVPAGELVDLGTVRQAGGKQVSVWAVEGDLDPATAVSNTLLTRVAAWLRTPAGVPGAGPARVGADRRGAPAARPSANRVSRPVAGSTRLSGRPAVIATAQHARTRSAFSVTIWCATSPQSTTSSTALAPGARHHRRTACQVPSGLRRAATQARARSVRRSPP